MNLISPSSVILLVFVIGFNLSGVKSQSYCAFDFHVFYNEGTFKLRSFESWFDWTCKDSYVVNMNTKKSTVMRITEASVDCSRTNLQLIDSNNMVMYDHCNSYQIQGSPLITKAQWTRVRKTKNCYFCAALMTFKLSIDYVDPDQTTTQKPVTGKPLERESCGVPTISPDIMGLFSELKIVGGKEVIQNSIPWQVYITDNAYSCGASLINNQWLLTAAHCEFTMRNLVANLGYHNIYGQNSNGITLKVTSRFDHPNYEKTDFTNDIALMKLERPIEFTDSISRICLPNGRRLQLGNRLLVTGWGNTDESGISTSILQQVSVTLNQKSLCTAQFGLNPLISSQICAGVTGPDPKDACQGDSGGPMVKRDPVTNSFYVAGIVSQGVGCKGHGVYTYVVEYEDWIKSIIDNN